MILYLDTSALVKRYFLEPFSDDVIFKWKSATQIATSFVAYAETMASLYRKKREAHLRDILIKETIDAFQKDWQSFVRVEINDALNRYIDRVVERYPLRGFDAVHLASAVVIHERFPNDLIFSCFDQNLGRAAKLEGLETFPLIEI